MTDAEAALSWKLTAETVQRAYDRLQQAAYNYLTTHTKQTLDDLWAELHLDGSAGG